MTEYAVGELVDIHWNRRWWPGQIEAIEGPNRYRISYEGYATCWNETVGPARLRKAQLPRG